MRSDPGFAHPNGLAGAPVLRPRHEPTTVVTPVRIVLGDAQRAFLEALALRLDDEPDVCVVAAATRPEEVERVVRSQPVDVAVLTADVSAADFVALGGALQSAEPRPSLVAVSGSDDTTALARAVRLGFRGWVPKEAGVPTLLDVVHAVRRGETWIPPLLLTGLLDRLVLEDEEQRAATAPLASLTAREIDVLRAMTTGASRQETARALTMSVNTVRTHTQSILRKLDVHSSLAAVAIARRAGLS